MADLVVWIETSRIGQLTGSSSWRDPRWPHPDDPLHIPVVNDTGRWGVLGVDMGACTEHSDGRLYIFFGDVATEQDRFKRYAHGLSVSNANPVNADLIGWTDAQQLLRLGGHRPLGWRFVLPHAELGGSALPGQPNWRFCAHCHGLFWTPDGLPRGVCPRGGQHMPLGLNFQLPNDHQGGTAETGQPDWRFCPKCHGLFWTPNNRPAGACPSGGQHDPQGWFFFVPFQAPQEGDEPQPPQSDARGQPEWRFCGGCHGLFWDGDAHKGQCPAARGGGGFPLRGVLGSDGLFAPLRLEAPYGITQSLEVPSGAFSHGGRVHVFVNVSPWRWSDVKRPVDPIYGLYLGSNHHPDRSNPYETSALINPRIGRCPVTSARSAFESHLVRGLRFVLPHSRGDESGLSRGWRRCRHCLGLFSSHSAANVCWSGGSHVADDGLDYALPVGSAGNLHTQPAWRPCLQCGVLFWVGEPSGLRGLCPAGAEHLAGEPGVALSHEAAFPDNTSPDFEGDEFHEDTFHEPHWRFCGKCQGLFFWDGDPERKGPCANGGKHEAWGLDFVLRRTRPGDSGGEDATNQTSWRRCDKCHGIFWADGGESAGRCPEGGSHETRNKSRNYLLRHDVAAEDGHQSDWRFCVKCAGLFWAKGQPAGGTCPHDGLAHEARGHVFVLAHNPGEDPLNQANWRFCSKCFALVSTHTVDLLPGIAPVVVDNASHGVEPGLPAATGKGLVMFAKGNWLGSGYRPGIRLAWAPLEGVEPPQVERFLYYTGVSGKTWTRDPAEANNLIDLGVKNEKDHWSSVSVLWLAEAQRWVLVYCEAVDDRSNLDRFKGPVIARISPTLEGLRHAAEIPIFDPGREGAYGTYANWPGSDFPLSYPPLPLWVGGVVGGQRENMPGWAYGAFLLERFTRFNAETRLLDLHYLLSLGRPYQVQVMHTRLQLAEPGAYARLFYGGNGLTPVDSGLPAVGQFYGIDTQGQLRWHRYHGTGAADRHEWSPDSGNAIGNGWQAERHVMGGGDGVILSVHANGDLAWYGYEGNGASDVSAETGWHPHSGNLIGNGWSGMRHVFASARQGRPPGGLTVFAVTEEGDLRWYAYDGDGTADHSGALGWHANSGNTIGNGWGSAKVLVAAAGVIFSVDGEGLLRWYRYDGNGEHDPSGNTGWHANSGNAIGNGWHGMRHLFAGSHDTGGFGQVLYAVTAEGRMRWYKYLGQGESDPAGATGWAANSGNDIGGGW